MLSDPCKQSVDKLPLDETLTNFTNFKRGYGNSTLEQLINYRLQQFADVHI